jgi:O-antigen ligase
VLAMLPLTQSRSGLLAFATFTLLTVRHLRWRWLLGALVMLLLALPLVPPEYWERLRRSLTFKQGSFEVFSFLVRIYGFRAAWLVFLDNPLIGVGYLGYRFVSSQYNDLRLVLGTAENFVLETLAGLGLIGLGVVIAALRRLYALGTVALGVTPARTLGHELARRHAPLLTAILVANMTGNTFVGLVGVGQLALWCALLVRSGHLAAPGEAEA